MEKKDIDNIINWIKDFFAQNSFARGVVIGMSGGKDSLIVAKLCIEALGKEKVLGVIMPNGEMKDISDAISTCKLLQIHYTTINIFNTYDSVVNNCQTALKEICSTLSNDSKINIAPRLRMTTLYALAQSLGYLVANTSNLSEISTGYSTKWGDGVGDFAPIADFTKSEVCEIGHLLGLPKELVDKVPADGLSDATDEDKMKITYTELDTLIRTGEKPSCYEQIIKLNNSSKHKRHKTPRFKTKLPNFLAD